MVEQEAQASTRRCLWTVTWGRMKLLSHFSWCDFGSLVIRSPRQACIQGETKTVPQKECLVYLRLLAHLCTSSPATPTSPSSQHKPWEPSLAAPARELPVIPRPKKQNHLFPKQLLGVTVTNWSNQLCSDLRDDLRKGPPASHTSALPRPGHRTTLCLRVSSWHRQVPGREEEAAALSRPDRLAEKERIYLSEPWKHWKSSGSNTSRHKGHREEDHASFIRIAQVTCHSNKPATSES